MGIHQDKAMKILSSVLLDLKTKYEEFNFDFRIIKVHGGSFQETDLPDVMVLTNHGNFWFELKKDATDRLTKLQAYNIEDFRNFSFLTGIIYSDGTLVEREGQVWYTLSTYLEFKLKQSIEKNLFFNGD